jgi:hypothetical protein
MQQNAPSLGLVTITAQAMDVRFEHIVQPAVTVHSSADYRFANGELQRTRNTSTVRGLNDNRNPQLNKGMKPALARLTLARKMAAITLTVWKKGERFDPKKLNLQVA